MAEEIVLNINVNGGQSIAEVKSLKQQFTEAEDALFALAGAGREGTAEFKKAQLEAAKLKERVDDINESLDDLKPEAKLGAFTKVAGGVASGFTAAAGASALFGAESEDLQKQLVKVQAAMAFSEGLKGLGDLGDGFKVLKTVILANPLFLIVGIVAAIGAALFALKDKISFVGDAFDALGGVLSYVVDKVKEFTDWLGISDFKAEEVKNNTIKRNEELIVSNDKRYDAEIRAAKRAGIATEELEIAKAKAAMDANQAIINSLDVRVEDEKKRIDELKAINYELHETILDLDDAKNDRIRVNREKNAAEAKALKEKNIADAEADAKAAEDELEKLVNDATSRQEFEDGIDAKNAEKAEAKRQAKLDQEKQDEQDAINAATKASDDQDAKDKIDLAKESEKQAKKRELQAYTLNSIASLSDSIFSLRLSKAAKGSAEETKIAKQQFKVNKALQLAQATMQGIQGVQAAFSAGAAIPIGGIVAGPAFAAIAAAAAIANIAKISSTQFEGGGSVSAPSSGSVPTSLPSAPTLNAPRNSTTQLNDDGTIVQPTQNQTPIVKAFVVENDITSSQQNVSKIESQATY